jgi:hypothetical protein
VVVDEAHKMSASITARGERTQRFRLGELLGAPPGIAPDDGDRRTTERRRTSSSSSPCWSGPVLWKIQGGAHKVDVSDLMRRMVKEDL